MDPLASELDALFQAPPGAMVEARNALAERLRKAGDKAGAARVKALKRPAPAAWALNQVHFQQPALLEAAQRTTSEVRTLHARDAVDPRALLTAHEAQRSASKAVIDAALAHCAAIDLPVGAAQQRRVQATLQALLTGAGEVLPGRLMHELEPSGFDAIESVGLPSPRDLARGPTPSAPAATSALSAAAEQERARTALAQCEKAVREAQAIAHKRRSARKRAEAERDKARAAVAEAERELSRLRAELDAREADFQGLGASHDEAESALGQAERELAEARSKLPQP